MRSQLKVIGIGTLVGLVLFFLEQSFKVISGGEIVFNLRLLRNFGLYILYSIPLSYVNGYFFDYLNALDWKRRHKFRFAIGLLGSVCLTLLTIFIIRVIHIVGFTGESFEDFFASENLQFYFIALIITLVVSLFFHALHFYKISQEKRVTEQKIIAGTASAKFESLKNQIDPHFLFNSLNVLTSLIDESPQNAQKFTTSLSKVYRYVLEQKDKELVNVEEELNFAVTYMNLLKMRFEDSIIYSVSNIDNPEAKVVPLSLQLLLENTVKHNVVSESKPLEIKIYEENRQLVVENNLQKKDVIQSRQGVGLKNIAERYSLVTSRKIAIEENSQYFRVKIPLLTKQIKVMETHKPQQDDQAYLRAKSRVKDLRSFYGNLLSYFLIIPFLIFINYRTFWEFQWFWFPLIGWGIGLLVHGLSIFGYGSSWEERKIREIMNKEDKLNNSWK